MGPLKYMTVAIGGIAPMRKSYRKPQLRKIGLVKDVSRSLVTP